MTLLALMLAAAPYPAFGGELVAVSLTRPSLVDPASAATMTDWIVARAVFETLYSTDASDPSGALVPLLASGLPEGSGTRWTIPLSHDVLLHDGGWLSPQVARDALLRLADTDARHVVSGLRTIEADGDGLRVELRAPDPKLLELLADPRAAIAVSRGQRWIGTGPFALGGATASGLRLDAFTGHRVGRPYVNKLSVWNGPTETGAKSMLRRGTADLVIDGSDQGLDVLYVLVGPKLLADRARREAMSNAIARDLVARRFLDGARPIDNLLNETPKSAPPPLALGSGPTTLLYTEERSKTRGAVERIQLDLLRIGVHATVRALGAAELDVERRRRSDVLLVEAVVLPRSSVRARLLAIAARYGVIDEVVGLKDQSALDVEIRARAGIVPIALGRVSPLLGRTLEGYALESSGVPRFDDVKLPKERTR